MRRTQPIAKKAKNSSKTHVHCYNGYMVNNNNNTLPGRDEGEVGVDGVHGDYFPLHGGGHQGERSDVGADI